MSRLSRRAAIAAGVGLAGAAVAIPVLRGTGDLFFGSSRTIPPGQGKVLQCEGDVATSFPSPSLAEIARRGGRYFGTAVKDPLFDDPDYRALCLAEFNALVCVYSMKWRFLQPNPGNYTFGRADRYAEVAEEHGMLMRGHTLVWHNDAPDWLGDVLRERGFGMVQEHIREVMGHYRGRIGSWDVVNEAVVPDSGRRDLLRESDFLEVLGPDYIRASFEAAAEADPDAELAYNCNAAPQGGRAARRHMEALLDLVEVMVANGTPIHAIGLQGHMVAERRDDIDAEMLRWFAGRVRELGLRLVVTELDVHDREMRAPWAERQQALADCYEEFIDAICADGACSGILTWGFTDRHSELARWPRPDRAPVRGMPFDECMKPTPMRDAIARALSAAPAYAG